MEGYAQLAQRMASHTDLGILRRFGALNVQNLLYLQAELTVLESKLRQVEEQNAASADEQTQWCAYDWQSLVKHSVEDDDHSQWFVFLELRSKLREYNEALAHYMLLSKAQKPEESRLLVLNDCFDDPEMKDGLSGIDRNTWRPDSATHNDLINLDEVHEFDHVTRWLIRSFLSVFHKLVGRRYKPSMDPEVGLFNYKEAHLEAPVTILSTVLSSLLPMVAIVTLYLVQRPPLQLAIMAVFTATFSLAVAVITKAKRVENFAATAAFVAVQVVFVGSNGPNRSCT